jgi:hypothetical protein
MACSGTALLFAFHYNTAIAQDKTFPPPITHFLLFCYKTAYESAIVPNLSHQIPGHIFLAYSTKIALILSLHQSIPNWLFNVLFQPKANGYVVSSMCDTCPRNVIFFFHISNARWKVQINTLLVMPFSLLLRFYQFQIFSPNTLFYKPMFVLGFRVSCTHVWHAGLSQPTLRYCIYPIYVVPCSSLIIDIIKLRPNALKEEAKTQKERGKASLL